MSDPDFIPEREPPWHFWGQQEFATVRGISEGPTLVTATPQLARVGYKRPDTWHWLFTAMLTRADVYPLTDTLVEVHFDLIVGIGRSTIELPSFQVFGFPWAAGDPPPLRQLLFASQVVAPQRVVGGSEPDTFIDQIVAESINCKARVLMSQPTPEEPNVEINASIQASAMFAPKVHVRPDWFLAAARVREPLTHAYRGREIDGR